MPNNKSYSYVLYVLATAVAVALVVVSAKYEEGSVGNEYKAFAQCLTETGVKHYTASWCPNCANQKALLGKAWKYIDAKECDAGGSTNNLDLCKDDGITSVPVWEFVDESRVTGTQTLEFLSQRTGCGLDGVKSGDGVTINADEGNTTSTVITNDGEDVVIELDESVSDSGITIEGISVE